MGLGAGNIIVNQHGNTMTNQTALIEKITSAFADVQYPGDRRLIGSSEGTEPAATAEAFKGQTDRYNIDANLLDKAPKGLSSALCFFSDEAFHFYLPAYMIADIRGQLREVDVVFHLTHGLDDKSRSKLVNSRRYGQRTWFDTMRHRYSVLTHDEVSAIVAYLQFKKKKSNAFYGNEIDQALKNYWNARASFAV